MILDIMKHRVMQNKNWKQLLIIVFLLPIIGFAQVQELNTEEEVMVIAPFNPSISKANRLAFSPLPDTNHAQKIDLDYLTNPKLFATNFSLEKLAAAKFIDRRSPKYSQNFVKAGFGMYTMPYVELFINKKLKSDLLAGVHIRHLSSTGGVRDVAYSGYSLSSADIWAKQIRRKYTSKININYNRNQVHYYGFRLDDYPIELAKTSNDFKDDINQVYSHAGVSFDIKGNFDTKKRDWDVNLSYQYFWDYYQSQEHLVDLTAHYDHPVEWFDSEVQFIGLEFSTQTYQTNQSYSGNFPSIDTSTSYFHGLYDITPYYHIGFESVDVQLGAKLSMGLDTNTRVSVAPMIKINIGIMRNQMTVYALADGGFYNNSMSSLSKENPYISPVIGLKYTKTKYHIQAGLKGRYLSYIDYHAYVETAAFEDMPMFVTDTSSQFNHTFTTIYDGGNKFGAGLELLFKTERWNVKLNGQYQSFTMDTASRAWQKPEFLYELGISYYVLENLKVTGVLQGQSKMYALYNGENIVEPWMDFSMMVDYHLKKNLGFFVNFSNIFSDQYYIWYGYPVQSFGVLGGVHFSF
jgi:hypothetical protein